MIRSIIGVLVGIIVFLIGLVINISENFASETYWIGTGILLAGIAIVAVFVIGKIKDWF